MSDSPVTLRLGRLDESSAEVAVFWRRPARPRTWLARVYGPHCSTSRTLPAEHALRPAASEGETAWGQTLVTEPCYWEPALPFLYDLTLEWRDEAGVEGKWTGRFGLPRWQARGTCLLLNGQRTVLRGVVVDEVTQDSLRQARAAEAALWAPAAGEDLLSEADRLGVGLIVDFRPLGVAAWECLEPLTWHPAVLLAVVEAGALAAAPPTAPPHVLLGTEAGGRAAAPPQRATVDVASLPAGAAASQTPVGSNPLVVVGRGFRCGDIARDRAACGALQAALAPRTDLAGYFVE